ncbi:MAG: pyruvate ferredoxin oxidoreductase [Candidatus Lokiarchaeota archaeon]|nr:pyruvate ferredoxin oxidoreductase [Candidatus Lokiarchaeota archaeon]
MKCMIDKEKKWRKKKMENGKIYEIRWHGRGGQGTVTAAKILGAVAFAEGYKGVQSIPLIGAERRGSPIKVFSRISRDQIRIHSQIYEPDIVICIDPSLFADYKNIVIEGLKEDGILIVNTIEDPSKIELGKNFEVCTVDATGISVQLGLEFGGAYVVNAPMLGAIAKVTKFISLEGLMKNLGKKWKGEWGEKIQKAVKMAYEQLKCIRGV